VAPLVFSMTWQTQAHKVCEKSPGERTRLPVRARPERSKSKWESKPVRPVLAMRGRVSASVQRTSHTKSDALELLLPVSIVFPISAGLLPAAEAA
jgi:hypothetical protein